MTVTEFEGVDYVQSFLDKLKPEEKFLVVFQKTDGSTRRMVCILDPNNSSRHSAVPVVTDEGWRSFRLSSVYLITKA
jgi:hypothetical protein